MQVYTLLMCRRTTPCAHAHHTQPARADRGDNTRSREGGEDTGGKREQGRDTGTEYRRKRERTGGRHSADTASLAAATTRARKRGSSSESYFEVSTIREHRSEKADRHVTMAQVDSTAAILLGWLCCSSLPSVLIRPAIGPCECRLVLVQLRLPLCLYTYDYTVVLYGCATYLCLYNSVSTYTLVCLYVCICCHSCVLIRVYLLS